MIESISKFVQIALAGIATIAIPYVVYHAVNTLRVLAAEARTAMDGQQLAIVEGGLQVFIVAMTQSGLLDNILRAGESGLRDLAHAAETWLSEKGLPGIDFDFLVDLLKHELAKQGVVIPAPSADPVEAANRSFALRPAVQLSSAFK